MGEMNEGGEFAWNWRLAPVGYHIISSPIFAKGLRSP